MCGLFGNFGEPLSSKSQQLIFTTLKGRGPDDQGLYLEKVSADKDHWLTLFHTRLAIQDLSPLGHQPMASLSGDVCLIFNGEIYNQLHLRTELQQLGFCFSSNSDTEVLLHGYQHWGNALWGRLNGIFAVAIWDRPRAELILARDNCGVKPLLWKRSSTGLAFGSELSAFEAAGLASRGQLSPEGLQSYALWGAVAAPNTMLHGVEVFPPGHFVVCSISHEGIKSNQLNTFKAPLSAKVSLSDLLMQAVSRQAIGDRPVGLFLSGGLDSGLLAAQLRRSQQGAIHSVSVGFEQLCGAVDESDLAALTAAHLGLKHQRVAIGAKDLDTSFDAFLDSIDQPSIDGFNTFLVAKAARAEGMVVAFSGLGADELFYGYSHMEWTNQQRRLACRRIAASGLTPWRKQSMLFERVELCGSGGASIEEFSTYMVDTLLRDSDAVTMAQGLELRVPFLDPDLIAYAQGTSAAEHLVAGPKSLLRQEALALLPPEILRAPKRGFNLPLAPWLTSNKRFSPSRLMRNLTKIGIPPQAIWRSWCLMQLSPKRYAPYWRWVVLSEWANSNFANN